jgi:DNA polymerase-3 subunit beta
MKYLFCTKELQKALKACATVLPKKASLPVIENVLMQPNDGIFYAIGTDLEITIATPIAPIDSDNLEAFLLPQEALQVIGTIRSENIEIEVTVKGIAVRNEKMSFDLSTMTADNYPKQNIFEHTFNSTNFTAVPATFKAIHQLLPFVSGDEYRPAMTGLQLIAGEHACTINSTDGYRLGQEITDCEGEAGAETISIIIPARVADVLLKRFSESTTMMRVIGDGNNQTLQAEAADGTKLTARLISERFPHVEGVIPKENKRSIEISKDELISALTQAAVFSGENKAVAMTFTPTSCKLKASDNERGAHIDIELPITWLTAPDEEPFTIGCNVNFFKQALQSLEASTVEIQSSEQSRPMVIQSAGGENTGIRLLMPIRIH